MPKYPGPGQADLILATAQRFLFKDEDVDPDEASIAFLLDRVTRDWPPVFSVEIHFDEPPGAFQFDVQGADSDEDEAYDTMGTPITHLTPGHAARFDGGLLFPRFVRGKLVSGAGKLTAILSR